MEKQLKHLEFIQGVVSRLGANSFWVKGWAVVLVSALFFLAVREERIVFSFVALLPLLFLWALDGYFLWQERLFRALYDQVRGLNDSEIDFSMNVGPFMGVRPRTWPSAIFSKTLVIFYVALALTVTLAAITLYLLFNGGSS